MGGEQGCHPEGGVRGHRARSQRRQVMAAVVSGSWWRGRLHLRRGDCWPPPRPPPGVVLRAPRGLGPPEAALGPLGGS